MKIKIMKFTWTSKSKANENNGSQKGNSMLDNGAKETNENQAPEGYRCCTTRIRYTCELLIGVAMLIAFSWYLAFSLMEGRDNCEFLFKEGKWIDGTWQPVACKVHTYNRRELETCIRNKKITFIGDSRLHILYHVFETALSNSSESWLNKTEFVRIPDSSEDYETFFEPWVKEKRKIAELIIIGYGGLNRTASSELSLKSYQENLKKLKEWIVKLSATQLKGTSNAITSQIIWKTTGPAISPKLQGDRMEGAISLSSDINFAAEDILTGAPVRILEASYDMAQTIKKQTKNNITQSVKMAKSEMTLILNSFCNQFILPKDATCCKKKDGAKTRYHYSIITIFASCMLLCVVMVFWSRNAK